MNAWDGDTRRADVVILTAIPLEFDAVLKVDAGAVPGSSWEPAKGPSGLPVAFRSFVVKHGRPLRVAVAVAADMGATAATNALLPLVAALKPRCIAMCGVCAGRPGKTRLGDVVAADRLFYTETGKQLPDEIQQDLTTYKLRDDWKAALEGMDVVGHFRDAAWFRARPLTTEAREHRALVALRDGVSDPWKTIDPTLDVHAWGPIVESLREHGWLARSGRDLTHKGRKAVDDLLFERMGALPDMSPSGTVHPFRLHVAPMGSGSRVIEDETVWAFISQAMRKTLGLEMEATALGELAHRQRQYKLDAVVMKGVMDFANPGRDDHFKEFAARASAECSLWFLREHISTEVAPGFDDLLASGTSPPPSVGPSASSRSAQLPSFLLNARHAVVPWHEGGRSEILADLDTWADDASRPVAVRLLHGEGGIGKTRLAIEWVRRRRERHDAAGFLPPNPDSRWLERLCDLGPPVLVVIEYAESRGDLVDVLERVAAFAAASGPHRQLRVLLLARGDGDWWAGLRRRSGNIGALLEGSVSIQIAPLAVTVLEREAVFVEAAKAFAKVRGRPAVLRPPIALDDERFSRVLYLHMAALAAVEDVAFDAGSLMDAILDHEERFWVRQAAARHSVDVDVALARQLVAAATLRGGFVTRDEARTMCARLEGRPFTRDDDVLVSLLHDVYERADDARYLPGLEPDLLGEGIVLRVSAPPKGAGVAPGNTWIERVLVAGDDERAITTAFTVLGRASASDPTATNSWIVSLLQSELPVRSVLALRAAKAVGRRTAFSSLGNLLADALEQHGVAAIALDLEREGIPRPMVSLTRVAEWQSRTVLQPVHKGDILTDITRAEALAQHGVNLADLGHREAALAAMREAVHLFRTLASRDPDSFQPALATCLSNLGSMLSDLGQREEALTAAREAVNLRRTLATHNPDVFQPDLATGLLNLGGRLMERGEREAALTATREAVDLHRALAARNPDLFQPGLAMSLNNLGSMLGNLGLREAALAAAHEAVALYRTLAARHPDAIVPNLAGSLDNLGRMLSGLGQREEALASAREAVNLYRTFVMRDPNAFEHHLARSLNNLGIRLSDLGQHEEALTVARAAVDLYRRIVIHHPDALEPLFARSLSNLGGRLSDLEQYEEALVISSEAVTLWRTLTSRDPAAFQPDLALSMNNQGILLSALDRYEPALVALDEAVDLRRILATRHPDAFQPALATSLRNMGHLLTGMERHKAALEAIQEALDLIWPYFEQLPRVHADLTDAILHAARFLHKALDRELPAEFLEREAYFAAARTPT